MVTGNLADATGHRYRASESEKAVRTAGGRVACWLFAALSVPTAPAAAQVIDVQANNFSGIALSDGVSGIDADGLKDGVLTLGPGIYRAIGGIPLVGDQGLDILPGAIVRANHVGVVSGRGRFLRISGATIASWYDDRYGGDANGDGSATAHGAPITIRYPADEPRNVLDGSTLVRAQVEAGQSGAMAVTNNRFVEAESASFLSPTTLTGNTFDAYRCTSVLTVWYPQRTAAVSGNTFSMSATSGECRVAGGHVLNLIVGSGSAAREYFQATGTTSVSGNTFSTPHGMRIVDQSFWKAAFDETGFHAYVSGNTFVSRHGNGSVAAGTYVLIAPMDARIRFENNVVQGYEFVLGIGEPAGAGVNRLFLGGNQFLSPPGSAVPAIAFANHRDKGLFVQAENNYWGASSGPRDASNADGLQNARGEGIGVPDWIDYIPFVGSGSTKYRDRIAIRAQRTAAGSWTRGTAGPVRVEVTDFYLQSAADGLIQLQVVDDAGDIVMTPTPIPVLAGVAPSATDLTIVAPATARALFLHAALASSSGDVVQAAPARLELEPGVSGIHVSTLNATTADGKYPEFFQGKDYEVDVSFDYDLGLVNPSANGLVRFSIEWRQRNRRTNEALLVEEVRLFEYEVAGGTNLGFVQQLGFFLPFRNVGIYPDNALWANELRLEVQLVDDTGAIVDRHRIYRPFGSEYIVRSRSARLGVRPAGTAGDWTQTSAGRGDAVTAHADVTVTIPAYASADDLADLDFRGIVRARAHGREERVAVFTRPLTIAQGTASYQAASETFTVPAWAETLTAWYGLVMDEIGTVAADSVVFPVRGVTRSQTTAVPARVGTVDLSPLAALFKFASPPAAGSIRVDEHPGPFVVGTAFPTAGKTGGLDVIGLIPTLRYWTVATTLTGVPAGTTLSLGYDPAVDFPSNPGFSSDSLVVAAVNPLSGALEPLATTHDPAARTVTAAYLPTFGTWVVASRSRSAVVLAGERNPSDDTVGDSAGLAAYPNPFREGVTFVGTIPSTGEISVRVFDLLGRRVRTLHVGSGEAGESRWRWDGTNDGGRDMPSGLYMVVLEAEGRRTTIASLRIR